MAHAIILLSAAVIHDQININQLQAAHSRIFYISGEIK